MQKSKPVLRTILAWGVHLFTASGAVWGMLSIRAIFAHEWRAAIGWMILAIFVDGFDGMLARWADVKQYAGGIDGALLDNILDYLNYVVVPALFLIEAEGLVPGQLRIVGAVVILLSSAYQFTQTDAKTEDHYFKGFPSYWNIMVLYMLILQWNPWLNFFLLIAFVVLVFVPVNYIYPSRNTKLRQVTMVMTYLYAVIGIWAAMQYPDVPTWAIWSTMIYVAYYAALSLWPKEKLPANA